MCARYSAFLSQFLPTPSARRATQLWDRRDSRDGRFLPTPSARRATSRVGSGYTVDLISTHALREEGDLSLLIDRARTG